MSFPFPALPFTLPTVSRNRVSSVPASILSIRGTCMVKDSSLRSCSLDKAWTLIVWCRKQTVRGCSPPVSQLSQPLLLGLAPAWEGESLQRKQAWGWSKRAFRVDDWVELLKGE